MISIRRLRSRDSLFVTIVLAVVSGFSSMVAEENGPTGAAAWIWHADAKGAANSAAAGNVYFQKDFNIPRSAKIATAVLDVGADNAAEVVLNGKSVGKFAGWNPLGRALVTAQLRPGKNLLAVRAENPLPGPAGLLLNLRISFEGNTQPLQIASDGSWDASAQEAPDWQSARSLENRTKAQIVAKNGELPWGLCLPLPVTSEEKVFPQFTVGGEGISGLDDMLKRFHPACNMDVAGTYALAWLPPAMLWVGDSAQVSESRTRARIGHRIGRIEMSPEGYVSCHQHEGLAHSEGWPFPLPTQSKGVGFYFTLVGLPYGKELGLLPALDVAGWKLDGVTSKGLDSNVGWALELDEPNATVTSPEFDLDAFISPFIRVKWNASDLPEGAKPYLEWTTAEQAEFSPSRRLPFPKPSSASKMPIQDFDIPVHELTGAKGRITRLRIGFGNPTKGQVTILRVFSAVDSRHTINNPNYLIAAADFYDWTGDRAWLETNLGKMRRAAAFMISEFKVREAHLLRTPWIGHDGRSGLEITPEGKKIIHNGVGIGGNYWDLIPFGGDDALATIYLYSALKRMARIEDFVAGDTVLPKPAAGLHAADLHALADQVRTQFRTTFWNPQTERFAPKDDQGRFRDFGFTFLNNEAMFYGLADEEQARKILSWIEGGRVVEGDTSQGADIYRWRFAPRATTRRNLDYYAYVWSGPETLNFGDQVQDGGAVLGFSYHDIMARIRYLGADNAWKRLSEILTWYRDVQTGGGARAYYSVPGRGTLQGGGTAGGLGIDEEFYESVLTPAVILDGFLGFAVRPDGFDINPQLPADQKTLGVTNVAYRNLRWDILAKSGAVLFNVKSGEVDRPLLVRLPEGAWTVAIRSEEGGDLRSVQVPDGRAGFKLPAGKLHQLTITKQTPP